MLFLALSVLRVCAFSGQPQSSKEPVKVLVTGAAGKTGRIVLSKLGHDHRYDPKGLFRTEQSAKSSLKNDETLCQLEHVVVADVTSSTFLRDMSDGASESEDGDTDSSDRKPNSIEADGKVNGLENIEAIIICTSAVPRIRKRSLAAMLVKAPWRALRGEPVMDIHSMRFGWKNGGYPEKVDYRGQIAQIDLAKKLGIPHVVLVSAMGGTDPNNFINSVGKRTTKSKEKEGHGDILLWKRRAEKYLVESGLDYTILHPGHLVDAPGGLEEFVLGVDDELYDINHHKSNTTSSDLRAMTRISREDVAELCVAALSAGKGKKTSFDCITMSPSTITSSLLQQPSIIAGIPSATSAETATMSETTMISAVSEATVASRKPAEEVLKKFLERSISTNYDLHP